MNYAAYHRYTCQHGGEQVDMYISAMQESIKENKKCKVMKHTVYRG